MLTRVAVVADVDLPRAAVARRPQLPKVHAVAEAVAVLAALLVMLWALGRSGGRDYGTMPWALPVTAVAALLTRPWRRLPTWALALVLLVPATALLTCYVDPVQWAYARDLAVWPYAAVVFLAVVGFARDEERRRLVVVAVCMFGLWEFAQALYPWLAFHDPARPMVGTFYWHNQLGTFMGSVGLLGLSLVPRGGYLRLLGVVTFVVGAVSVVLSTSRASLALFVVAVAALVVSWALLRKDRLVAVLPVAGGAAAYGVVVLLRHLVTVAHTPAAGQVIGRLENRPLQGNLTQRFDFWRAAVGVFLDRPITGGGQGSYFLVEGKHMPAGGGYSRWVHNGVLNAFADGGLLFGLPVLAAAVLLCWLLARRVVGSFRLDGPEVAVALAGLLLLAHAYMDFDWVYPVMAGQLALVGALLVRTPSAGRVPRAWSAAPVFAALAVVVAVVALAMPVWQRQQQAITTAGTQATQGDYHAALRTLAGARSALVPDPLLAAAQLAVVRQARQDHVAVPAYTVRTAVDETRRLAVLDPAVRDLRASTPVEPLAAARRGTLGR